MSLEALVLAQQELIARLLKENQTWKQLRNYECDNKCVLMKRQYFCSACNGRLCLNCTICSDCEFHFNVNYCRSCAKEHIFKKECSSCSNAEFFGRLCVEDYLKSTLCDNHFCKGEMLLIDI